MLLVKTLLLPLNVEKAGSVGLLYESSELRAEDKDRSYENESLKAEEM